MFEDIKQGDQILAKTEVYGFQGRRVFYVPAEVKRTTKTQFEVDGTMYRKSTGEAVAANRYHNAYPLNSIQVSDGTSEMNDYKRLSAHHRSDSAFVKELHNCYQGNNGKMSLDEVEALRPHIKALRIAYAAIQREEKEKSFLTLCDFDLSNGYTQEDVKACRNIKPELYDKYFGDKK